MPQNSSVGIDVSKSSLDVSVIHQNKCFHCKFKNTKTGIKDLENYLNKTNISSESQVVMESTGDYHLLCAYILTKSFNVKVINPLLAKHHMQTSIRKVKTDKVDSKKLAELGLKQELNTLIITKDMVKKIKLISLIDTLEKHKAALKLSEKNSRKIFGDFEIDCGILNMLKEEIKRIEKLIEEANSQLRLLVRNTHLVQSIDSIAGITQESAVKVLSMIEDREFKNKKALVAFSGLDVSVKESGLWRGKVRISKRGSSQLRKYLIRIAWGLLMHNEEFQKYIEKYKMAGRKYMELLVILARKFLKMLYGSLKNNEKFDLGMI